MPGFALDLVASRNLASCRQKLLRGGSRPQHIAGACRAQGTTDFAALSPSEAIVADPVLSEPSTSAPTPIVRSKNWPKKSSLYILRTDGKSCSRELVTGTGKLHFAYPSTQQHLLVWRHRPKSVMVIMKLGDELLQPFLEVIDFLGREHNLRVVVEPHVYEQFLRGRPGYPYAYTFTPSDKDRLAEYVDFVVCIGGDGVILHSSCLFKHSMPPVIAFNMGSMGFLTNHDFANFKRDLMDVIYGGQKLDSCTLLSLDSVNSMDEPGNSLGVMVTLRMRLVCEIWRKGGSGPEQSVEVLNEMVIDRGSSAFLTNIECYEKGRFIARVQADGIMLATPTGSTAYSVAAGGSMVHPNVPAILLTPVCPHSLSFRPIILPDYAELELRIPSNARCTAWVCFDGRSRQELGRGDSIKVRMSENPVPTINRTDLTSDWFDSLERCFRWSDRTVQKPLELGDGRVAIEGTGRDMNGGRS
ncbi:hypothetical protein Vretimale_5571 [Volvox reticuliferus]|uniref:Uncharacterized protein n=1 Tax=Volvox reticuliferus TaxID=1737510 RepID=A0A8J4FLQ1_9CHLO|nr:hypothetical protein Vretifemale_5593 [Volvox reticuliferus]GIM00609.1 hypothetical protein Vretimale_5571 [Volvox reticuliferus]